MTDQEKEQMPWLTSEHYAASQTIANDAIMHEGPQTRSQLQQPAFSTQQPVLPTQQPALPTQQPTLPEQQPALPTQQPTLPTQQPAHPTQQPALSTQQPMLSTKQPAPTHRALFSYKAMSPTEASLDQGELVRFLYD